MKDHSEFKKDLDFIKNLLKKYNIKNNNFRIKRIGDYNKNKPRLLKLMFNTRFDAYNLLKKSRQIIADSKTKIFITNDKTLV